MYNSWEDIKVYKYLDILDISNEFNGQFEKKLELLIYLDEDDSWEESSFVEVIQAYNKYKFINTDITNIHKSNININDIDYKLKDYNKLDLAEWIDLDILIEDVDKNLTRILSILYKKYKTNEWNEIIYEPYSYSTIERSVIFEDLYITDVYNSIIEFIKYREKVLSSFKNIFSSIDDSELTDEEKEMLSEEEIANIEADIEKEKSNSSFNWQRILDIASNNNWSSIPKILELPHVFIFNMLSMKQVYGD